MSAICLSLLFLTAAPTDEVVAKVNLETITASQLKERQATTQARGGAARLEFLLEDLINDALMAQDGYKLGLAKDPEVVAKVAAERARLAGDLVIDREIAGAAAVSDAEVIEAYHLGGDLLGLKVIIYATEAEATALLQRLGKGASFAEEAKHSLDPQSGAAGGDWGVRSRGQLDPALAKAAFATRVGALGGPVKLDLGYAVFQVQSQQLADAAGLAAKKADLRRFLEGQRKSQLRLHYTTQLRASSKATIDEAFLRSTGTHLTATAAEAEHVLATVGPREVRYKEVLEAARATFGGKEGGHLSGFTVKSELAWRLVDRALIEQAAIKRGLGTDPTVVAAVKRFEHDEVARARAQKARAGAPAPSAAEVEEWYRSHLDGFKTPGQRTCSHLVVKEKPVADQLRERLKKGESFAELASAYSIDQRSAASGGELGVVTDDGLAGLEKAGPQLARALREAKPGEVGGPVQTQLGWHLVTCGAVTPPGVRPLEAVREPLMAQLTADRGNQAVVALLNQLRTAAVISRDAAALGRAGAQVQAGSKP